MNIITAGALFECGGLIIDIALIQPLQQTQQFTSILQTAN